MIRPAFALALLFAGVCTVSTPAAFAQQKAPSLEYKRRAPAVLPPASEVEKDAAQAAEEIEAREQTDHRIEADPSRRPDLDPDVVQGIQSRGLHDLRR